MSINPAPYLNEYPRDGAALHLWHQMREALDVRHTARRRATSLRALLVFLATSMLPAPGAPLAFPGAVGFGRFAQGARGGAKPDIYVVTNLLDDGRPGSLRDAIDSLSDNAGRFIVFDVAGLLHLRDGHPLVIDQPYVTIAGQTAPQGGICLVGEGLEIRSHDVIVRGLRIRPGDYNFGAPKHTGQRDAITVGRGTGAPVVQDVIVDHCSLSWALDETASAYSASRNVTFQYNLAAEALHQSIHVDEGTPGPPYATDRHSTGILTGPHAGRITIYRNVLAHAMYRLPRLDQTDRVEFVNNVIYNYGTEALTCVARDGGQALLANVIGNLWLSGPNSHADPRRLMHFEHCTAGAGTAIYLAGNGAMVGHQVLVPGADPVAAGFSRTTGGSELDHVLSGVPVFEGLPPTAITQLSLRLSELDFVLDEVGARWPLREAIDERVITSIRNRTGSIVDTVAIPPGTNPDPARYANPVGARVVPDVDANGDPKTPDYASPGNPRVDLDDDGVSDTLQAVLQAEPLADDDGDGYLNIEEFLNQPIGR